MDRSDIHFWINPNSLPRVSALDTCMHTTPYIHFKRKYQEYILYVMMEGEMYLREGAREYHLVENDVLLLDPTRLHVGTRASTMQFAYVHFTPGDGRERFPEMDAADEDIYGRQEERESSASTGDEMQCLCFPKYYHLENEEQIARMRTLCENVHEVSLDDGRLRKQKAAALAHAILLTVAEDINKAQMSETLHRRSADRTVQELMWYLRRHYMEHLTSQDIEHRFGYQFDHLNRLFRKHYNDTIFHYLGGVRCDEAKKLLGSGYYSALEVAMRVGFGSSEQFSHVYKRYMGHSPRADM